MIDVTKLDDQGLKNLMENHRRLGRTEEPAYGAAAREWNARHGGGLNLETSLAYLRQAARERRFVSYGELAEANGASWDKVRYPMNAHLWALVEHANHRGWPMLSAMIVNKSHRETGEMEPETLAGFTAAAEALRYEVADPVAFLRSQQELCFQWGQEQ
jgi:5-methylcytosine-specific restriction protein B